MAASWNEGRWLVTDRQSAGRGRQGRAWSDGAGNFMGSTLVDWRAGDPPATSLALLTACAVHAALLNAADWPVSIAAPMIKWPNDLLVDGAKIAGILLERSGSAVIIGVGVNLASAPALPDRPAMSLKALGIDVRRDDFARALAEGFRGWLSRWRDGGLAMLLPEWSRRAHPPGTPISVHAPGGEALTGTFDGLEPDGTLRLRLADGTVRQVAAGDVALAGPSVQQGDAHASGD